MSEDDRWLGGADWESTEVEVAPGSGKRRLALEADEARLPELDNPFPVLSPKEIVERWLRAVRAGLWGQARDVSVTWISSAPLRGEIVVAGVPPVAFASLGWMAHAQAFQRFRCVEQGAPGAVSASTLEEGELGTEPDFEVEIGEGGDGGDDLALTVELAEEASPADREGAKEILAAWGDLLVVGAFPTHPGEPISHGYAEAVSSPYENELLLAIESAEWSPSALTPLLRALQSLASRSRAVVAVRA
jgi:hypothetical protein